MRSVAAVLAGLTALIIAAGYGGRWVPALDLLALVRVPAVLILLILGLALRGWWKAPAVGLAVIVLVTWAIPRFTGAEGAADLVLYQKNVLRDNPKLEELAADIRQSGADVVTLQEIGPDTSRLLDLLRDTYPAQVSCRERWEHSPAVISRLPSAGAEFCDLEVEIAALQVETDHGRVWVASVHLNYPWPAGNQASQSREIAAMLEPLDGPVLVAGDFNNVPWSGAATRIAEAAGGKPLGPWQPTRWLQLGALMERAVVEDYRAPNHDDAGWIPVTIDHVLAPDGRIERRPFLGSDHLGLLAQVMLEP